MTFPLLNERKSFAKNVKCVVLVWQTAGAFIVRLCSRRVMRCEFCETLSFSEPRIPLICNTDAQPFVAAEATDRLAKQIISPVRYEQGEIFD